MSRHATCHRVYCIFYRYTLLLEQLGEFAYLMLCLRNSHSVTRHDHDLFPVGHEHRGVIGSDLLDWLINSLTGHEHR